MIIVDFRCQNPACGRIEVDVMTDAGNWKSTCPWCWNESKRIIAIGRVNTANDDAVHIREAAKALLDPDTARKSDKPHVRELAERPTRANLNRYLKAEGLRYAENEKGGPPVYKRPEKVDMTKAKKEVYESFRKSRALTVNAS
jgi:predicted DsbA family dithiol-disulfide isomerase